MRLFATMPCSRLGKLAFQTIGVLRSATPLSRRLLLRRWLVSGGLTARAKMNDLARQLLTSEAKSPASSEELAYATERICQKLLLYLSKILGRDGCHALLRRSLKQAQNKF